MSTVQRTSLVLLAILVLLPTSVSGQSSGFGQYQLDLLLTQTYQAQIDALTAATSGWNRSRSPFQDGRFVDILGTAGALDLLRRSWLALEGGQLATVREIEGQIGQIQPRVGILGLEGQNWVGVAYLFTDGSWNGIRFNKPDRVRRNFEEVVVSKLFGILNQAPKSPQLAGVLLHYSYVYYTSTSKPTVHYGEEIQFRIPAFYMEQFLSQRITTDQMLGATTIVVKSLEDQVAQRIQLGIAPPPPPAATPPTPPPSQPSSPTLPPSVAPAELPKIRAIRELQAGKEIGVLMIGDIVVFRISTAFEGRGPLQRAEFVAEKLNRLLVQGLKPDEVKSSSLAGRYIIIARDEVLLTIDAELARSNGTSPPALATLWAKKIQDALLQLK